MHFYSRLSAHQTNRTDALQQRNLYPSLLLFCCWAVVLFYLIICGLFNDTVISSGYMKSNGRWVSEYRHSPTYAISEQNWSSNIFETLAQFFFAGMIGQVDEGGGKPKCHFSYSLFTNNSTVPLYVDSGRKRPWLNLSAVPVFVWMDWRKPIEIVWIAGLRAEIWTADFSRKQETTRRAFDSVLLGVVYKVKLPMQAESSQAISRFHRSRRQTVRKPCRCPSSG